MAEARALLVPGWGTAPSRFDLLATALREQGVDTHAWSYAAAGSYDSLARGLAQAAPGDGPVHLVGHSLGGLIVAAAAVGPMAGRVASVTTVNAPWRGTWLGWTASGPLATSLRWGAPELEALRGRVARHLDAVAGPRWLVLASAVDLGVPATSALRSPSGSRLQRRALPTTGHTPLDAAAFVEAVTEHVRPEPTRAAAAVRRSSLRRRGAARPQVQEGR